MFYGATSQNKAFADLLVKLKKMEKNKPPDTVASCAVCTETLPKARIF
jgi:hypothetical protein